MLRDIHSEFFFVSTQYLKPSSIFSYSASFFLTSIACFSTSIVVIIVVLAFTNFVANQFQCIFGIMYNVGYEYLI